MSDRPEKQYKSSSIFVRITHFFSDWLLDNPYLFNHIRFLLAGNQKGMKTFIASNLNAYMCKTIADFCCGTGDFAVCTPETSQYYGWDLNPDFISFANKKYRGKKNISFDVADVVTSPKIHSRKFDAVLLISAVHHLSDKELAVMLPKIKNVTKKVVIIADIIPDPPHPIQRFFARIDRGRFVRPKEEKLKILRKYFTILHTEMIPTQSAVQCGIVCGIK